MDKGLLSGSTAMLLLKLLEEQDMYGYQTRMVERTDHILVLVEIHPCLSADAGVHLRQQRSGNLDKINSPQISGGCETCHIPHNSAS